jgi:hypothetical protein
MVDPSSAPWSGLISVRVNPAIFRHSLVFRIIPGQWQIVKVNHIDIQVHERRMAGGNALGDCG